MSDPLLLDGHSLTIADVVRVARSPNTMWLELASEARERMAVSRRWVEELAAAGAPVYGINTGFGVFSERKLTSQTDMQLAQRNLVVSHAVGVGEPFPAEVVRAAMLIRANTLALGYSGVRAEIAETLLAMLNRGVTPVVPSLGSLGSSGDLAPLSHLALVLSTDAADRAEESGEAWYGGQRVSGKGAMVAAGIPRVVLGPKEALALTNGATFSAALAALAAADAGALIAASEMALALTVEAMKGASAAFDERLHAARGHPGQEAVAGNVRRLIAGSTLVDSSHRVQDAYSIRCAPQVMGPARDMLEFVEAIVTREITAATDNPLLFDGQPLSGGNFHGEVVGLAMDYLAIALAEVGALAERRIARLLDDKLNGGLPPMLVASHEAAGLNSGFMMPHYTAAALALENQALATPDSVRSLPTASSQEDHNANSAAATRHARQIVQNVQRIVAVEMLAAAQAVDLRWRQMPDARLGHGTARAYAQIREAVPFVERDQLYGPAIEALTAMMQAGKFSEG